MGQLDDRNARVLVFAPIGRDGSASTALLRKGGILADNCVDLSQLIQQIDRGAAAVFIAEEGLFGKDITALSLWVQRQPAWSDLPFIVLTSRQDQPAVAAWRQRLIDSLHNVSFLERPVQPITLTTALRAALRARKRQYEVRVLMEAQRRSAEGLENEVVSRTRELEEANRNLRTQMNERARVEETLRQAQKIEAIGQLTGGVAHDFNNLLMVISGGLAMLDRQSDPDRRLRLMEGMQRAAQRGASLTRQLLAFSRRQELKPESVDLACQIGGMRELLDRSLRGDVHVTFDFPDDLWPVEVDPGELELVVLNLAVNSRDAMPNGGTITVRANNSRDKIENEARDFVSLSISDTGCGIAPDVQARVFEPFFTTKEIGRGSGLGLAQVHGFVQQSGGTIEIDSEMGQGTTITLYLPKAASSPSAVEHHLIDLHGGTHKPTAAGCVLLVEDDEEVAALVNEMLLQLGYDVIRVSSAAAALGALSNDRTIDIVFSDIMMPGTMNGVDLAREVRRRREGMPVLLTSGYAEAAKTSAEAEGLPILAKPYQIDELASALQLARTRGLVQ
ncbi:signal transduction histidine kinase [Rhodoligotrophos appendicifer]|uniref:ATP-binding protein n=1 Tax=Rhodoligotrophos appendicifer TaxID=987056 RepID=UPI001186C7B0|nr:ATP-binding protein [Rhodoligotrophos appendicifer]